MQVLTTWRKPYQPKSVHMQCHTLTRALALGACALLLKLLTAGGL